MKNLLTIATVCLAASACSASMPQNVRGEASDTPDRFLVLEKATGNRRPAAPGGACFSPLVDPRDATELTLVRSAEGRGDYAPEAPRYGLAADELLRIDCGSGAPLGKVKR